MSGRWAIACTIGLLTTACDPFGIKEVLPWKTYSVPSSSMEPTIAVGARVVA